MGAALVSMVQLNSKCKAPDGFEKDPDNGPDEIEEEEREEVMGGIHGEFEFDSAWPIEEPSFWPGLQDGATASMRRDQATAWALNELANSAAFGSWLVSSQRSSSEATRRLPLSIRLLLIALTLMTVGLILSAWLLPGQSSKMQSYQSGAAGKLLSDSFEMQSNQSKAIHKTHDDHPESHESSPLCCQSDLGSLAQRQQFIDLTKQQCLSELNFIVSLFQVKHISVPRSQALSSPLIKEIVRLTDRPSTMAMPLPFYVSLISISLLLLLIDYWKAKSRPDPITARAMVQRKSIQLPGTSIQDEVKKKDDKLQIAIEAFNELLALHVHHRKMLDDLMAIQELLMPDQHLIDQIKEVNADGLDAGAMERSVLEAISVQKEESRKLMDDLTKGGDEAIARLVSEII